MKPGDFGEFFASVNDGSKPFEWQQRLVNSIIDTGRWPERISAPTGAGKSAVVEAHIFVTAYSTQAGTPRLPRRLSIVVGRRALVDSHVDRATRVIEVLKERGSDLLVEIGHALEQLRCGTCSEPIELTVLRGALAPSRNWLDAPSACQIICATPDMWGSRLLLRGYGSSLPARPREAGLLALDSVLLLDEAHLSRQLEVTSRAVGRIVAPDAQLLGIPGLQVVSMTATPAEETATSVQGVSVADLANDQALAERLGQPKPVTMVVSPSWRPKARASAGHVNLLCEESAALQRRLQGPIGCVVNRVDTAVRVAEQLGKRGLRVELWVGRLRPMDLQRLKEEQKALFDSRLRPELDVLVATQTVEVGVDLDLHGLVTELAPASAIVQRAGRVNRRGSRASGPVVVLVPTTETPMEDAPPYKSPDLEAAAGWLRTIAQDEVGLSGARVLKMSLPVRQPLRLLYKRPERYDALRWAKTSTDWATDESLELWLRDDLSQDQPEAGLVVRRSLPEDDLVALDLLRHTMPTSEEVFPVLVSRLRKIIDNVLSGANIGPSRAYIVRNGLPAQMDPTSRILPGDIVVIDKPHAVTRAKVVVDPEEAVSEPIATTWGAVRDVILPGHPDDWLLGQLGNLDPDLAQEEFYKSTGSRDQIVLPAALDEHDRLPWLVRETVAVAQEDEDTLQQWTATHRTIPLDRHQTDVAERALEMAGLVGLPPELVNVLKASGLHHDDGKDHPAFQRDRLQNPHPDAPLAKSTSLNAQSARRSMSVLPMGWRHEHRSVALAAESMDLTALRDQLCLRLIGTSHGYGRGAVPHGSKFLTTPQDPVEVRNLAAELFDEGGWNGILEATEQVYGVWGCAYLEALLRAADCQVSGEGR